MSEEPPPTLWHWFYCLIFPGYYGMGLVGWTRHRYRLWKNGREVRARFKAFKKAHGIK